MCDSFVIISVALCFVYTCFHLKKFTYIYFSFEWIVGSTASHFHNTIVNSQACLLYEVFCRYWIGKDSSIMQYLCKHYVLFFFFFCFPIVLLTHRTYNLAVILFYHFLIKSSNKSCHLTPETAIHIYDPWLC